MPAEEAKCPSEGVDNLIKEQVERLKSRIKAGDEAYNLITKAAALLRCSIALLEIVDDITGKSDTVLVIGPKKKIKRVMKVISAEKE